MEFYQIMIDIILFAFVTITTWAAKKYLIPYIQDKHLEAVAEIAVHAAEAYYGALHGDEKFAYAIKVINEKFHIDIDKEKIAMAIEAAWKAMDIEQIRTGDKEE